MTMVVVALPYLYGTVLYGTSSQQHHVFCPIEAKPPTSCCSVCCWHVKGLAAADGPVCRDDVGVVLVTVIVLVSVLLVLS